MKKITIIPARSGSKGVPNKNILDLGGVPMFVWSILHAKYYSCKNDKIYVSSDSEKYLEIAIKFGAIPHKRSPSLAKDSTKTEPVMEEVLSTVEIDDEDLIILLQPTSPIRKKRNISSFFKIIFIMCIKNIEFKSVSSKIKLIFIRGVKFSLIIKNKRYIKNLSF